MMPKIKLAPRVSGYCFEMLGNGETSFARTKPTNGWRWSAVRLVGVFKHFWGSWRGSLRLGHGGTSGQCDGVRAPLALSPYLLFSPLQMPQFPEEPLDLTASEGFRYFPSYPGQNSTMIGTK